MCLQTHHQVSDDKDHHEDNQTHGLTRDLHAVPHGLDPLSTQDPEDDEEGVEEVVHVPAGKLAVICDATDAVFIVLPEQLHADHSEDEDDDGKYQSEVPQSTN